MMFALLANVGLLNLILTLLLLSFLLWGNILYEIKYVDFTDGGRKRGKRDGGRGGLNINILYN